MTRIKWNEFGTRFYEVGLDRGVLYAPDGSIVPWNGLVSVEESATYKKGSPVYLNGELIYQSQTPGNFQGSLSAFTYPDEFAPLSGMEEARPGLFFGNQTTERFGLSWRSLVNGVDSVGGYKIHILYNVLATPSNVSYKTIQGDADPMVFDWDLSAIPSRAPGYAPTSHIVLDSRKIEPYRLESIERYLYGDDGREPTPLGQLSDLVQYMDTDKLFTVTDNGDGTWTAEGPDSLIEKYGAEWFLLNEINVSYPTPTTYTISTTEY